VWLTPHPRDLNQPEGENRLIEGNFWGLIRLKNFICTSATMLQVIGCWAGVLSKLIQWSDERLNSCLPLASDTSIDVSMTVFGLSDFISSDLVSQRKYMQCIMGLQSFNRHYKF